MLWYLPWRYEAGASGRILILRTLREHALDVHIFKVIFSSATQDDTGRAMTHAHVLQDVIPEVASSLKLILERI
jgi:hypothetical protein